MKTETVEHSYLMDRSHLLLLLSLVDSRPVIGVPLETRENTAQADVWKQAALSLMQSGQLVYAQGRLFAAPGIRELLLSMKDAAGILMLYEQTGAVETLYLGSPAVSLELSGRDGCILRALEESEQVSLEERLEEWLTARLPEDGVLSEETAAVLEREPDAAGRIRELERCALPFGQPPFAWGKDRRVQAAADLYDRTGRLRSRRIWIALAAFSAVIRQDSRGCHACPDTRARRKAFLRECLCSAHSPDGTGLEPADGGTGTGKKDKGLPDAEWKEEFGRGDGEGEKIQ